MKIDQLLLIGIFANFCGAALIGCVSLYRPSSFTYVVDVNNLNSSQVQDVLDVCEEYNVALGDYRINCILGEFDDSKNMITSFEMMKNKCDPNESIGCASILGRSFKVHIYLLNQTTHDYKTVIRHEMGHTLGLMHSETGAMRSHLPARTEYFIDDKMVERIKERNGW